MSLNIVTVPIDVLPAVVPQAAGYLQSDACLEPEIKESCDCEAYSCTTTVDFEERCSELEAKNAGIGVVHNLRGLYCVANYLHHSRIRRYGDLFADLAHFLATTAPFLSTACIAEFLTAVFQPLRYEMVQAYGRLVHFLSHEDRPAVDSCLRELVSAQLKRILRQRVNFVGGVMRIGHPQKQQPLSGVHYGSSRHRNYRSFRMITSRRLAATWEDTQVAAEVA